LQRGTCRRVGDIVVGPGRQGQGETPANTGVRFRPRDEPAPARRLIRTRPKRGYARPASRSTTRTRALCPSGSLAPEPAARWFENHRLPDAKADSGALASRRTEARPLICRDLAGDVSVPVVASPDTAWAWTLPDRRSGRYVIEPTYEQKLAQGVFHYALTSTQRWAHPIGHAAVVVTAPRDGWLFSNYRRYALSVAIAFSRCGEEDSSQAWLKECAALPNGLQEIEAARR
jgi:hypothetical protein